MAANDGQHKPRMRVWEPRVIFLVSLLALTVLDRRITTYLDPTTGDEPFYLMTAMSIARDFDLNECNNYRQRDEAALYPEFYTSANGGSARFPVEWKGWRGAPYPLPPHPALIVPPSRQCISTDPNVPLPADGTGNELYSKHGLGLSLLVLPMFTLGGRALVVFFLNVLGALLAVNIYRLAREATHRVWPALLTWLAFAFTVPLLPYSFLIFPEMPAALLVVYAFRRIRLWENNRWQVAAVGFSLAFLPWLHYRFTPVTASLFLYYLYQELRHRTKHRYVDLGLICGQSGVAAVLLMIFFYHRYGRVMPNAGDHAGSSDLAGTARGAAGLFLDQQWGLFIAAPVFILTLVGVLIM
ncbi:MAG: hypothetical protein M3Y27_10055, partial [Acidobacteriota bacterium]|nr:hypothetical protein [Acidobacteriota bacterium]